MVRAVQRWSSISCNISSAMDKDHHRKFGTFFSRKFGSVNIDHKTIFRVQHDLVRERIVLKRKKARILSNYLGTFTYLRAYHPFISFESVFPGLFRHWMQKTQLSNWTFGKRNTLERMVTLSIVCPEMSIEINYQ